MTACTASTPPIEGSANDARVAKADPDPGYVEVGPVSGENGAGCGPCGAVGTYDGAVIDAKNMARGMGADPVEIMDIHPPHAAAACRVNTFRASGVAFRRSSEATPIGNADTRAPAAPERTTADRLCEAKELYDDGLLTDEEYQVQRQAILAEGL